MSDSSTTVITSACADVTARLFTGAHAAPSRIGFIYGPSSGCTSLNINASVRSINDVVTAGEGVNVYLAPFAGTPVTEEGPAGGTTGDEEGPADGVRSANTVKYVAVTSGSTAREDYVFDPSAGYAQFLGSLSAAYVYGAVLLAEAEDGSLAVVAARDLRDSSGAGEYRASGYDLSLVWRITFN